MEPAEGHLCLFPGTSDRPQLGPLVFGLSWANERNVGETVEGVWGDSHHLHPSAPDFLRGVWSLLGNNIVPTDSLLWDCSWFKWSYGHDLCQCDVSWCSVKISEYSASDPQGKKEEYSSLDLFLAYLNFCTILPDLCVQYTKPGFWLSSLFSKSCWQIDSMTKNTLLYLSFFLFFFKVVCFWNYSES